MSDEMIDKARAHAAELETIHGDALCVSAFAAGVVHEARKDLLALAERLEGMTSKMADAHQMLAGGHVVGGDRLTDDTYQTRNDAAIDLLSPGDDG